MTGQPRSVSSVKSVDASAKPAAPAAPPAKPTGDYALLAAATPGSSFAIPEDGIGVLTVPTDDLFTAVRWAKDSGYKLLSLLSAYDRTDHFGVLYCLLKPATNPLEFAELRLRVVMPKQVGGVVVEPSCPSLCDIFPAADWQEREMYDMYGIKFEGHPDLRRMFLPEGWTGYPMRKDSKEPEQYVAMAEGEDIVVKQPQEGAW